MILDNAGKGAQGTFPVAAVSQAKAGEPPTLAKGHIARVTTGAPIPEGANAVIMVEHTLLRRSSDDGAEEKEVQILAEDIRIGENVREIGSDVTAGEVILRRGEAITTIGGELGLLASVGTRDVLVHQRPIVGILSTGDEIVEHDQSGRLAVGEVRDTNRMTLLNAVRSSGFEAVDLGIVNDQYVCSGNQPFRTDICT